MKRFTSFLLSLAMLLSLCPINVWAEEIRADDQQVYVAEDASALDTEEEPDASSSDLMSEPMDEAFSGADVQFIPINESATFETKKTAAAAVAISEENQTSTTYSEGGDFTFFISDDSATITGYAGSGSVVEIPSELDGYPVTAIGDYAFDGCTDITTLVLPDSMTEIGAWAFRNCTKLASVNYPLSLEEVSGGIFAGCSSLTSITVPEGITNLPDNVFEGCDYLQEVILPSTLETIGSYAFGGCTSITEFALPDSVTTIGGGAFKDCVNLTSVNYPLSLSEVGDYNGGYIFAGCKKLTRITIPEGVTELPHQVFEGCTYLEKVKLPSTLETIGESAFSDCTGITEIAIPSEVTIIDAWAFDGCTGITEFDLPDSLTTICTGAFNGCTGITALVLPDSVTTIGDGAFKDCVNLTSVNYPLSLSEVGDYSGGYIFAGCKKLTRITVPEGVTELPYQVFEGCTYLEKVKLPSTLETIGQSAFSDCTSITEITIPDSVTTIGVWAFDGCAALNNVMIPSSVTDIGEEAFCDCPNLILSCNYLSYATIYAIENNIPFLPTGVFVDKEEYALDRSGCSYHADLNGMAANGYVSMKVSYSIKESHKDTAEDTMLHIVLPPNATLVDMTLKLDGVLCTEYVYDEQRLEIPVTAPSGELRFYVEMTGQDLYSYATLSITEDGETTKEIIGILNEKVNVLTLNAPETISTDVIPVSGVAPPATEVILLVDGVEEATVVASKAGNWSTEVHIAFPLNYKDYIITAQCTANNETTEQSTNVEYRVGDPQLTGFSMSYNGNEKVDLLNTNGKKPLVYFSPGTRFDFMVKFDAPEAIDTVYVTSTRNQEKKYLEATYDEEVGAFVTAGYFDGDNTDYVPGKLCVEYIKKHESVAVSEEYDWEIFDEVTQNASSEAVVFEEVSDSDILANVDLGGISEDLAGVVVDTAISVYDEATDGDLGDWLGVFEDLENLSSYVIPGQDDEQYLISMDYSDPYSYAMLIRDVSGSTFIKFALETGIEDAESLDAAWTLIQASTALSTINDIAGLLLNMYEIETDMDKLREEVRITPYANDAQREAALKMVDDLEKDQQYFALITTILPWVVSLAVPVVGATMTGPAIVFTAIMGVYTSVAPIFWQYRINMNKSPSYTAKFVVDPSGYVYDINTMERLEGVKATAYCILEDDSADFWGNIPSDDQYGTIWNASEYDQENPLYTNADGKYAWDVPTGWWRVKYEKEGYVTTWSEWLPVPPPQTEVNIGLVRMYLPGDVNLDGEVNADDLTALARHVAKIEALTDDSALLCADVDGNGSLTADDLTKLARYVAKIIPSL